jgi:chromosome segregation ATPase
MTAQATAQRNSASVETEIRSLVSKRSTIESQQQKLSRRGLEIDEEIAQLKPRHFEGDTKAAPAIATLETEKKDLLYKIEGAEMRIRQFDEEIMPLRLELRGLRELDVAEDARRRFDGFQRKLEDLVSARIATYRAACRALYEEAVFVHSEIDLQPLNDSEKGLRLRAVEQAHKKLEAMHHAIINTVRDPRVPGWKDGPAFGPGLLTHIMAKLPPEQNGNGSH